MTDQHPLTDEICFDLMLNHWAIPDNQHYIDMRAAADWQLEQVIEWIRDTHEEYIIKNLQEAMRPTTTQETN